MNKNQTLPSPKHAPTIQPKMMITNLSSMEYSALFIIGISLLLRVLWIGHFDLLVEETYYWNYAQHLDFGYLDHPPMIAVLIKLSTAIFGTNEFAVRIPSIFCWLVTAVFCFKLTNLISRGAGLYAVMLLAILPFFFLHSLVITPDQPLTVCWSAMLYCLYRSLILDEAKYWYAVGVWLGLGMLSKYTIVLLGPVTLLYMCVIPSARTWFTRKEPYACALIAALLFTPVIYWNATHQWASFIFQSSRRLTATFYFAFHHFVGIFIFFLLPPGIFSLWILLRWRAFKINTLEIKTIRFLQFFTLAPLMFFAVISLSHAIKFNWIGPGLLALIPWLAIIIKNNQKILTLSIRKGWMTATSVLLICYGSAMFIITFGAPEVIYKTLFTKFIDWGDLTQQVHTVASHIEAQTNTSPIIVPLDLYNIGSEFSFYQAKFLAHGEMQKIYPIIGRQIFGAESLMYRYWSPPKGSLAGKTLIIISNDRRDFNNKMIIKQTIAQSPLRILWSHSQVHGARVSPYYYQVVQMKT